MSFTAYASARDTQLRAELEPKNLELEAAKHREDNRAREHVDQAADVRTTVRELRQASPVDFQQSLNRLTGTVPSPEVHVEFDTQVQTDEEISATVVRAAQEIITNTIKYAEATELMLTATLDNDMLTLTGTNDGVAPRTVTLGHGLTGPTPSCELSANGSSAEPTSRDPVT